MTALRSAGLIALAACAACADLPDIDPDTCGNLVVDLEEDCDGFGLADGDGTVCAEPGDDNECFFVCGAEGGACPQGWGCGSGRCRASGLFDRALVRPAILRAGLRDRRRRRRGWRPDRADVAAVRHVSAMATATSPPMSTCSSRSRRAVTFARRRRRPGDVVVPIRRWLFVMLVTTSATSCRSLRPSA
jgi:hypothetical protein